MPEIIFHQYAMSPFSEKIRKIFALKNLEYREVDQPAWMPKPHLTPMTGGYRRIPVLQIGADIYCDSALIARKIDQLSPEPSIYPDGKAAAAEGMAMWADKTLFFSTVPLVFTAMAEVIPKELFDDRRKMSPQLSMEVLKSAVPGSRGALASACAMLDASLSKNAFVLGDAFSVADAAVFHTLWFVRSDQASAGIIYSKPSLADWFGRVEAMGSGTPVSMSGDEAMEIARSGEPEDIDSSLDDDPSGLRKGMRVGICSDDLPTDVFVGKLICLRAHEMVIEREDPAVGRVAVHFPRAGYQVRAV
ncbi:MAG TPA: glutathione S-transferase family protein [Candidatus Limnocylindrales bacterium]|nr:glutathione S-transferase family protein [Candidatus Limnocylindrales bacterium]